MNKEIMKKGILQYINKLEGFKTAIKSLHWNSISLPQHQLCDDIASLISEHQDQISEVEQAIHGNLAFNKLVPTQYHISNLETFVKDVISTTNTFYKHLKGDEYIGMRSDCESFLSELQRKLYLVRFTLKEEVKGRITESFNSGNEYVIEHKNGDCVTLSETELNNLVNFSIARTILMREGRNNDEKYKIRQEIKSFIQGDEVYEDSDDLSAVGDLVAKHISDMFDADMSHWSDGEGKESFEITTLHGDKVIGFLFYCDDEGEIWVNFKGKGIMN